MTEANHDNDMLRDIDVERGEEYPQGRIDTGEVEFDLDFAEGVEYDVDVGPDGNIIVQYWRDIDTCVVCGEELPDGRNGDTCSTKCVLNKED